MPGGKGKLRPEDNPKPFKPGQSGNPKGAPISIRNQIREILAMDGKMHIKEEHVISQNDDGSVYIIMPKKDMVAMKVMQLAMTGSGSTTIRALQLIIEHLEGKPHQSASVDLGQPINQMNLTDEQFQEIMKELKPKEK